MKRVFAFILLLSLLCSATAVAGTLDLPEDLTAIADQAFMGDKNLDTVVLPDTLKTIGSKAFADGSIRSITFPASVTSIADDAFDHCAIVYAHAPEGAYANAWFTSHPHYGWVRFNYKWYYYRDDGTLLVPDYESHGLNDVVLTDPNGVEILNRFIRDDGSMPFLDDYWYASFLPEDWDWDEQGDPETVGITVNIAGRVLEEVVSISFGVDEAGMIELDTYRHIRYESEGAAGEPQPNDGDDLEDDGYDEFLLTWDYRGEDVVLYLDGTEIGTLTQYGFRVIMTLNGNDPINFDEIVYGDG